MKSIMVSTLLFCTTGAFAEDSKNYTPIPPVQMAATCFFKYEQISGMNKICFYDCLGSASAITISSVKLCPLTING